jgi:type I restriction enzyme M protein
MANGSMSTSTTSELQIRQSIIEADMVDCMIALPGQLFYTTQIPVCLWFLTRSKKADPQHGFRDRQGETLFIDARKMGTLTDRVHRELTDEDIAAITRTYHAWRGEEKDGDYEDVPGFCKAAPLDDVMKNNYVLTPGRYVGIEDEEDDGIPFEEKMEKLTGELGEHLTRSAQLDERIIANLRDIGYDIE